MTTTPEDDDRVEEVEDDEGVEQPSEPQDAPQEAHDALGELHTRIRPLVDQNRQGDMKAGLYPTMLRAAFAKAFDICVAVTDPAQEPSALLLAPALRGLCEDLIVLAALREADVPAREQILHNTAILCVVNSVKSQTAFFATERPFQPIIKEAHFTTGLSSDGLLKSAQDGWKKLGYKIGGKKERPTTKELARDHGLERLYEYLYALASDVVHFNPRVLLRTGWSDDPERPVFSITHFSSYYAALAVFYSHYLLVHFYRTFAGELDAAGACSSTFDDLEEWLNDCPWWPEMVTFEELNRKEPTPGELLVSLILHKVTRTDPTDEPG